MNDVPQDIQALLTKHGQQHLVRFWPELTSAQRDTLCSQIQSVDFDHIKDLWAKASGEKPSETTTVSRIDRAAAPGAVIRQAATDAERESWHSAAAVGESELRAGRVAVITVAGGQGTRLGFDHPKGLFPIGPVSDRSLFQIFAEQILARRRRHQAAIPWFIMTSDATHSETVDFFRENNHFGLSPDSIEFFMQGSLPAVDAASGQVLLSSPHELALSPDGHGGLITALDRSGLLNRMDREGIRHLFYHQVDNPTVIMVDPAFIGFHVQHESMLTTNVVCKTSPTERMGVLVDVDGRTEIIEYSELTPEQAAKSDATGQWIFWAGNTAIHLFDAAFLRHLASGGCQLPLHIARKNVAFVNPDGQIMTPSDASNPNAIKMERFIFDALPLAKKTLIVEGNRAREFNPVKNRTGADSPDTSRAALNRIAHEWLATAGIHLPAESLVEISPLQAISEEELRQKVSGGTLSLQDLRMK